MGRYSTVLFDLDDTLSDFGWSQREAFAGLLDQFGIEERRIDTDGQSYVDMFTKLARPLWDQLERGALTLDTLNDTRFRLLVDNTDIDVDPALLAPAYLDLLGTTGGLVDGARELLDALHGEVRMGLITNGYSQVQRPRLAKFDLEKYFDSVVVSSEIGHAKPSAAFFAVASESFGHPDPATVLVVGDSLSSDIAGGINAGMGTCWFNPTKKSTPADEHLGRIDFIVTTLADVADVVRRP